MDKKNTMLLTVIAVATLLVAVVGATFAYFSIVSTGSGNTSTTFTGNVGDTGNFGLVTLTGVISELELGVTAADMSQSVATAAGVNGKSYYAYAKTAADLKSLDLVNDYKLTKDFGNYEAQTTEAYHYDDRQNHIISAATLAGQKNVTGAVIECTSTVTVTLDTTNSTMYTDNNAKTFITTTAQKSNGKVYVAGPKNDGTNTHKVTVTGGEFDLKELFTAEGNKKDLTVKYTFNGSEDGKAATYVTADVELINSQEDQTALAGKILKLTIANTGFTCDVTNVGTPAGA